MMPTGGDSSPHAGQIQCPWGAAVTRQGQELRFTGRHGHASLLQ
jgi:hypothetical protein